MERRSAWEARSEKKSRSAVLDFAEEYRCFLSRCKTERECSAFFIKLAEDAGFTDLEEKIGTKTLKPGDRVYRNNHDKSVSFFVIGEEPLSRGMNLLAAHIDSPRLDLKQNPLSEEGGQALFETHYYGMIKKYQWVTLPLALHGIVVRHDGTGVEVCIGEKPGESVLGITDLPAHLSGEQLEKTGEKVVEAEDLNLLGGNIPFRDTEDRDDQEKPVPAEDAVGENLRRLLKKTCGFSEEDLLSAELSAVPAGEARNCGLDGSMIMGYGQDDRSCAYACMRALLAAAGGTVPKRTLACLFVDKEEIGSCGTTGMESQFFEDTVAELLAMTSEDIDIYLGTRRALKNTKAISADVSGAYDVNYPEAFEIKNSAFLGCGLSMNKYTGTGGKYGCNDASAEYVGEVRKLLSDAEVIFQTAEFGKADQGGAETISYVLCNFNMSVLDAGIPVLSMHAPWEIISKADLYEAYLGYTAFLNYEVG